MTVASREITWVRLFVADEPRFIDHSLFFPASITGVCRLTSCGWPRYVVFQEKESTSLLSCVREQNLLSGRSKASVTVSSLGVLLTP